MAKWMRQNFLNATRFIIRVFLTMGLLLWAYFPAPSRAEEIPLEKQGEVYRLPVRINGMTTLYFIPQPEAAELALPAEVVLALIQSKVLNSDDFLPGKPFPLPDGSMVKSEKFILRSLQVGSSIVPNIPGRIGPASSSLLLGQSFLERLGPWRLDAAKKSLVLASPSSNGRPESAKRIEMTIPATEFGTLRIDSTPVGAEVSIDGHWTGYKTPLVLRGVRRGKQHALVLKLEGYTPWNSSFLMDEGMKSLNPSLKQK